MNAPHTHSVRIDDVVRERSMKYAFIQGVFWAVMFGVGECYFSMFAAFVKTPEYVFGLITGVPGLLGPMSQLFGADAVEKTKNRKRLVIISVILQCLCYAPLAVIPFLSGSDVGKQLAYKLLLPLILIYHAGAQFCGPAWNSWISVLIPAESRASWFARNSRAQGFISLIAKLSVVGALYYADCHTGDTKEFMTAMIYAGAFALAGITRFGSFLFIGRMYEPKYEHPPDATFTFWQFISRARESNFVRFVLFVSLINFGANIAGPYFIPYAMYDLKFEPWQWIAIDSAGTLSSVVTLVFWGSFSHRFGNKKTLQYTAVVVSLIPVLWLFSINFYYLVGVNVISGLAWAGFNLCAFNYILEAVSPPKRARCVAYFNYLVGVGIFCGSILGGWLKHEMPTTLNLPGATITVKYSFTYLLALSALVRLTMGFFFVGSFKELREVEPFELKDLPYYISEMRSPAGLRFGAVDEGETKEVQPDSRTEEPVP